MLSWRAAIGRNSGSKVASSSRSAIRAKRQRSLYGAMGNYSTATRPRSPRRKTGSLLAMVARRGTHRPERRLDEEVGAGEPVEIGIDIKLEAGGKRRPREGVGL